MENITQYKEKLLEEQALLTHELTSVGRINPDNPNDWEPTAEKLNIDRAEVEERASGITNFEDQSAVELPLEERLNQVLAAQKRIEEGTYGNCIICSAEIEEARLDANPAAQTCMTHKEQEPSFSLK
jgi:RNA polymerase-binding transcription factor DksA